MSNLDPVAEFLLGEESKRRKSPRGMTPKKIVEEIKKYNPEANEKLLYKLPQRDLEDILIKLYKENPDEHIEPTSKEVSDQKFEELLEEHQASSGPSNIDMARFLGWM